MELFDERQVRMFFDIFKNGDELTEIRLISNDGKIGSGYFTDVETLIKEVKPYSRDYSVYFVINKINPDCGGRPQRNKIMFRVKNTTSDGEIIGRDYVLIDIDSQRATGVNATEEQLANAKQKANEVYKFLKDNGFYQPIVVCSGSGVHLYLHCAMLVNEENNLIIKRFLASLGMLFSDEKTEIDTVVHNPARISRVMGFYNRKGSSRDAQRPQRLCSFVKVPDDIKVNSKEYFEKIANLYPEEEVKPNKSNNYSTEKFDLDDFIKRHGIEVTKIESIEGGKKYVLDHCLFNPQHKGKDAVIFQRDSGALAYVCMHNSCSQYSWQDVRRKFEPNAYERKYENRQNIRPIYNREIQKEFIPQNKTEEKGSVWLKMGDVKKATMDEKDFIPTGIVEFDKKGLGLMRKHLTVLTGLRSSGKTSLINMLILNQVQKRYNVGLWSGEMDASEIKQWLYLQAAGKNYVQKRGNSEYYETNDFIDEKISKWIDQYFFLYNNNYSNDILQLISEIKERHKKQFFDVVYCDNLMVLGDSSLSGPTIERNKQTLILLSNLAKELNIHIVLIAHPNKSKGLLRIADISGTADISNLAQNVFLWHRVKYDEYEYIHDFERDYEEFFGVGSFQKVKDYSNVLEIAKFRAKGTLMGKVFGLYYEKETGRFKNSLAEHINYGWQEEPLQQSFISDEDEEVDYFTQLNDSDVPF